ncbi:hypothetical protein [Streptomyces sp. NPDC048242]|uniref:hypothetical protein n=1 Tax=Streptomyces sp. NPDC048242 TaxID=3155026 RepID=UPI00343EC481
MPSSLRRLRQLFGRSPRSTPHPPPFATGPFTIRPAADPETDDARGVPFLVRPAREPGERTADHASPPDEAQPVTAPPDSADPPLWRSAGVFHSARQTLAALGTFHGVGAHTWTCRRQPGSGGYWLLSGAGTATGTDLVALHGGRAWHVLADGSLTGPKGTTGPAHLDEVLTWPEVTPVELAAAFPAVHGPEPGHHLLYVLTAPELLPAVARHTMAAAVETAVVPVGVCGLFPPGQEPPRERLLLILGGPYEPDAADAARMVPDSLVHAVVSLPRTAVCRPAVHCPQLLIDVRLRLPVDEELLQPGLAEDEFWLLSGSSEQPAARLSVLGSPAPLVIQPPGSDLRCRPPSPGAGATGLPPAPETRVEVRPSAVADTRVDAVLLTDDDLGAVRRYLRGRPLAESAFLVPGAGCHLLVDPADLAASLPFGTPLRRVGPGSCYVRSGHDLVPALPPGARVRFLGVTPSTAVACVPGAVHRFDLDGLVPVWTLWASVRAPSTPAGVSETGRQLLSALDGLVGEDSKGSGLELPDVTDPTETLARAARLYAQGHLVEAAEAYRSAGDPLEAGRLYEQAALRLMEER